MYQGRRQRGNNRPGEQQNECQRNSIRLKSSNHAKKQHYADEQTDKQAIGAFASLADSIGKLRVKLV